MLVKNSLKFTWRSNGFITVISRKAKKKTSKDREKKESGERQLSNHFIVSQMEDICIVKKRKKKENGIGNIFIYSPSTLYVTGIVPKGAIRPWIILTVALCCCCLVYGHKCIWGWCWWCGGLGGCRQCWNWSRMREMNNTPVGICAGSDKAWCCASASVGCRMDTLQPGGGARHEGKERGREGWGCWRRQWDWFPDNSRAEAALTEVLRHREGAGGTSLIQGRVKGWEEKNDRQLRPCI